MVVGILTPGFVGELLAVAHLRAGGGNARSWRLTLAPDAPGASLAPARACGEPSLGTIRPGSRADFVVLDPEGFTLKRVYIGGKRLL